MKTFLIVAIIATPARSAPHHPPLCGGPNSVILRTTGIEIRDERVAWLERCIEQKWPTVGGISMLRCIVARESGGSPFAVNGSYEGLLQIGTETWAGWWSRWHDREVMLRVVNDRFNARSNLMVGAWAMQDGLSPWGGGCS